MKTSVILRSLIAFLLCCATVFTMASCTIVEKKADDTTAPAETEAVVDMTKSIFATENYSLNEEELYYYMYSIVDLLMANNGGMFSMYGGADADLSKSLKDQLIMSDTTWYDYCYDMIYDYVEYYLILSEQAGKDGITLTDAEKSVIKAKAEKEDMKKYCNKVSVETVTKCMEIAALAEKCKNKILDETDISESALRAEFDKNKSTYCTVDYIYYSLTFADETDTSEEDDDETALTKAQAEDFALALKECKDDTEFENVLRAKLEEYYPELDDDEIDKKITNSRVQGEAYQEGYTVIDWLFDSERKQYDVYYDGAETSSSAYIVVMLTSVADEDTTPTVNAYHILLTSDTYGSDDAAKQKADELLSQIVSAEDKLETFKALCSEYTEDPGSQYTGGLYRNIAKGQMVQEFEDWCFADIRQEGDIDVVKTSYGYHIMYHGGAGLPASLSQAALTLQNNAYTAAYQSAQKNHPITSNLPRLDKMDF